MKRNRTLRIWGGFLLLLLLLFTFLIWNIFAGSVSLSASEIWRILLGGDVGFTQSQIIVKIRLPRLLSALILGGAVGNVIDRLQHGYVVDFIHWYYRSWHWPTFNIADAAITVGAVLLVLDTLGWRLLGRREGDGA